MKIATALPVAVAFACVVALGAALSAQDHNPYLDQEIRTVTVTAAPGAPVGVSAVPMPLGNGVVFGQVTEGDSNRPVAGAIVSLNLQGSTLRVMADAQGRFGFRDLPAGRFVLTTTRPGWVDGSYGRTRPGGPTLPLGLADGERVSGVTIPMWRFAAIAGSVADQSGDPLVGVPVRVLRRSVVGGRVTLTQASQDSTDDRGQYRVGNLSPGEYIVAVPLQPQATDLPMFMGDAGMTRDVLVTRVAAEASMAGGGGNFVFFNDSTGNRPAGLDEEGRPLSYVTTFYPNVASSARAAVINVESGDDRTGIDFQLKGVPTAQLSGTAMGPDGAAANTTVTLVPSESDASAITLETFTANSDAQGRFTFPAVPPGQYILRASRTPRVAMAPQVQEIQQGGATMVIRTMSNAGGAQLPTDPVLWAEMPISIAGREPTDVPVTLRAGLKVTGTLQFSGSAERPTSDRYGSVMLMLEPADPRPGVNQARGRVEQTGQFQTMGVPPGRYFVRVMGGFPNWYLHSVMVGGRDASIVPIDITSNDVGGAVLTFTDRPSEITGQVAAESGADAATVLVFPADSAGWTGYGASSRRMANTRVGKDGSFRVPNLPAGEYLAVAIPDRMANDWQNPKFLQSLAQQAERVRVPDAGQATVSLRVIR
jgi:hypothetical protein